MKIKKEFEGTIIDFGCGLGDAVPIYRNYYPKATIIGIDHSFAAIEKCRKVYGDMATFIQGDYKDVPFSDIIISSNVFEHLSDDKEIAKILLSKCNDLYIIVPYKEWPLLPEHVNSYDENSLKKFLEVEWKVFTSK